MTSLIERTRNDNYEPPGEESSEEEDPESEPETSTVNYCYSTTETSSGSKQAANFSKKWPAGREH